jgi:predicted amidohydrolase YtcJ
LLPECALQKGADMDRDTTSDDLKAQQMKKHFAALALVAIAAARVSLAEAPADLVLLNATIHTEDAHRSIAQGFAVRGNTIVAVGTTDELNAVMGPQTRSIDLGGRVVLPGIIDAHTHPAESAQDYAKCSMDDRPITAQVLKTKAAACLKSAAENKDAWFKIVRVDPVRLSLTRRDLDSILPARPMILTGSDGHTLWANSAALRAAHITPATTDPVGGRIERDASNNPTGTLRDAAMNLVLRAVPAPSIDVQAERLDLAFGDMRAIGITSVQDAAVDEHDMQLYKRLYDAGRLKMRVRGTFALKSLDEPAELAVDRAIKFRAKWAVDPEFLRADAIKIFADGVIEYPSQTAALLAPYLDAAGRPTGNRGPSYFTQANLDRIVSAADAAGFTVHVHAIGDRAVRAALDAFSYSRQHDGKLDNRDQIAHLELIDPADFARFQPLGVIANLQLLWAQNDDYIDATRPYIGEARSRYLYAARSLRDAGAVIVGGSDWSVSSFNPFEAMEHGVTRARALGEKPLLPEQSIALQDAVDAYTINAAYALKQERTTGSLEPGKRADFIILDRDIFAIAPSDLRHTRVLATYLDGREVYAVPAMAN